VNEHPDELLAEYVDGALGPEDRTRVEAHLADCEACGGDVLMARNARGALAGLPELEAPPGLALEVRRRARGSGGGGRAWRVVAPIAAAAVLVAGGIVILSQLSNGEEAARTAEGGGAEQPAAAPEAAPQEVGEAEAADVAGRRSPVPRYSESDTDYSNADLASLARRLRDEARVALDGGLARTSTEFYAGFDVSAFPPELRDVYRCVVAEVPPEQLIVPFAIEAASFQGEPAYIASFLQGPAPDQPYDRILMWVVGREDCSLRSLASQRL
jgi:hypothetical protein